MNKERLTKLAEHLRTVSPENFNMENWQCGTAACAVGHACMIPEFNSQGLTLTSGGSPTVPSYERDTGWSIGWTAVRDFFDLGAEAMELFAFESYQAAPTADEVADRIMRLVQSDGTSRKKKYLIAKFVI